LLYRVHDGGEGAEGNVLIGTDENELVVGIADLLAKSGGNLIDVDGVVAEKDALVFIDSDDGAFFGDLFDGAVTIKMISRTRTTSTSGVMLISARAV
jgi:hypothetical protein